MQIWWCDGKKGWRLTVDEDNDTQREAIELQEIAFQSESTKSGDNCWTMSSND